MSVHIHLHSETKSVLILILLLSSGCSLTPAQQQHVQKDTQEVKNLSAEAKARYCSQPYEARLAEHKAALVAVGVATGNPALGLIPYIDPCAASGN